MPDEVLEERHIYMAAKSVCFEGRIYSRGETLSVPVDRVAEFVALGYICGPRLSGHVAKADIPAPVSKRPPSGAPSVDITAEVEPVSSLREDELGLTPEPVASPKAGIGLEEEHNTTSKKLRRQAGRRGSPSTLAEELTEEGSAV